MRREWWSLNDDSLLAHSASLSLKVNLYFFKGNLSSTTNAGAWRIEARGGLSYTTRNIIWSSHSKPASIKSEHIHRHTLIQLYRYILISILKYIIQNYTLT